MTELRQRMGQLPSPADSERIWTAIWYQEAHHSTALEGNTLVMKQVEALLAEGRAVGNKELSEYLEVTGYAAAAQWVYGHAPNSGSWAAETPLTLTEVRHVHELAMGPVWGVAPHPNALPSERPGSFREHDIEPFPGGMVPPSWVRVQAAMTDWTRSLAEVATRANPVESLAAAHGAFERIHPFLDGNGRTGRLLLNLLLVRSGYPPAVIYTRDRTRESHAPCRCRRPGTARRTDRACRHRQPLPVRGARRGRTQSSGAARLARQPGAQPGESAGGDRARPAQGSEEPGWAVAQHSHLAGRVPGQQVSEPFLATDRSPTRQLRSLPTGVAWARRRRVIWPICPVL